MNQRLECIRAVHRWHIAGSLQTVSIGTRRQRVVSGQGERHCKAQGFGRAAHRARTRSVTGAGAGQCRIGEDRRGQEGQRDGACEERYRESKRPGTGVPVPGPSLSNLPLKHDFQTWFSSRRLRVVLVRDKALEARLVTADVIAFQRLAGLLAAALLSCVVAAGVLLIATVA